MVPVKECPQLRQCRLRVQRNEVNSLMAGSGNVLDP